MADQGDLIRATRSLCPICLTALPAEIRRQDQEILLCRTCPEHGFFSEVIWRGQPDFESWSRPKLPAEGVASHTQTHLGCPHDCGLCPEHGQHPCTVLLEITDLCNLNCPVCFAASGSSGSGEAGADRKASGKIGSIPLTQLSQHLKFIRAQAGEVVLQLSGGEPTLHPHLVELTAEAATIFPAVQLNTNGLLLAEDPTLAVRLAQAGLSWVFLQFDGTSDHTYEIIRGRRLLAQKMAALEACKQAGLPVILTPTVAAKVNDGELGELIRLAVRFGPTVRGVHIQPMTTSGRNSLPGAAHRLTLPEVLNRLVEQTNGLVRLEQAFPPSCEHERCSFHLRYRREASGQLRPAAGTGDCCRKITTQPSSPGETAENRRRSVDIILNSWQSSGPKKTMPPMLPTAAPDAFDRFLAESRQATFSITCMAFQDAWTADLERLRGCCVHIFQPPNRFLPFCAGNLTTADGHPLHRR